MFRFLNLIGDNYSKFSLGEVYCPIRLKLFSVMHKQSHKIISDGINDYIPPQIKILNIVIVIYFLSFTHQKHNILGQTLASSVSLNTTTGKPVLSDQQFG